MTTSLVSHLTKPPCLYSKLPEGHFRLIKLLPGKWDQPLQAELFEADQSFSYIALSYTWGNRRVTRQVLLNGIPKSITINLDLALRTLRLEDAPVTIWADALCINQDDILDKGAQVSFMNQIFNWAVQVRASVGDPLDRGHLSYEARLEELGSSKVFQFSDDPNSAWEEIHGALSQLEIKKPAELSSHERCRCIFGLLYALSSSYLSAKLGEMDLFSKKRTGKMEARQQHLFEWLRVFIVAPWWDRMWITQEVGVARELLLTYGKVTMSFQVLTSLVKEISTHSIQLPPLASENSRVIDLLVTKVKTISELRRFQQYESIGEMRESDYFQRSMGSPLLWLLRTFRYRHSSEPKDKIFALNQLLRKLNIGSDHKLEINYATTVAHLFCTVAVQIMDETGLFWITSADLVAKSRDKLPSWVPNWTDGFTAPNSEDAAWKIRLCHNVSEIDFAINTADSSTKALSPSQYFHELVGKTTFSAWDRLRGANDEHREPFQLGPSASRNAVIPSTHLFLDWKNSECRRIIHEHYEPDVKDTTKIENCLMVPSQFCSSIEHVSDPIAPDLSNLYNILKRLKSARYIVFPNDWKSDLLLNSLDSIGRVLCFGALLENNKTARRLESYDEPDLALLVQLLTHSDSPSEGEILSESMRDWKSHYREKITLELRSECQQCFSKPGPCEVCQSRADATPIPTVDNAWQDPRIIQKHRTALQTAPGNCILMTRDGYLALGPPQTKVRDRISIISGGLCPYILRHDKNPKYIENVTFQLIGDCFLDKAPKWDPVKLETVALV
ncbi:hypothetical protein FZEAL_4026 [Fusarium zealandicum]|uniref:Heterokaryon incompatibility domain-containing protein n=1 Tax=Fusarium zealandicum TaxID=1053134 RepID=A0A8H4UND7_9HYPO|nr:hypothetical protein FZEAL_4026 [Fusarium zealandicum]